MAPPRMTIKEWEAYTGQKYVRPDPPRKVDPTHRGPNKWEQKFANGVLWPRRLTGETERFEFEPFTLVVLSVDSDGPHLSDTRYTPDWVEWWPDGRIVIYEIKGFERTKDILRFKMAAASHPEYEFFLVKRPRGKGWKYERFKARRTT